MIKTTPITIFAGLNGGKEECFLAPAKVCGISGCENAPVDIREMGAKSAILIEGGATLYSVSEPRDLVAFFNKA